MMSNKRKLIIVFSSAELTIEGSPAKITSLEDFLIELHACKNGMKYTIFSNQTSQLMNKIAEILS